MQTTLRHRKRTSSESTGMEEKDRLPGRVASEVTHVCFPRSIYYISSVILVGLLMIIAGVFELRKLAISCQFILQNSSWATQDAHQRYICDTRPVVWVHGKNIESGYLRHVLAVFEHLGYRRGTRSDAWTVLWSHEYPFVDLASELTHLKPHQRVNHFPGSGYITNKVSLSTGSQSKYIPTAFKLPQQKETFLAHSHMNPSKLWVQKGNHHRGIQVKRITELSLNQDGTFVQEFITKPLLVDGKKFDIGVYTVMTALNPLRVYTYNGDVLLRFCSKLYTDPVHPLELDSYVVGDNYTPIWQMPSLQTFYVNGSLSMKESLDAFLRKMGQNPKKIWTQIEEAIASVYLEKEQDMIRSAAKYQVEGGTHFFELVRFDFVVDEDLNVFLMEANMSPNLSSAHFPQNRVLYEQVVLNSLSLIGIGSRALRESYRYEDCEVSNRNIMVFPDECSTGTCRKCSSGSKCRLCPHCLTQREKQILKDAFLEHHNRRDMSRIIPARNKSLTELSGANEMMWLWFEGKCQLDAHWCS